MINKWQVYEFTVPEHEYDLEITFSHPKWSNVDKFIEEIPPSCIPGSKFYKHRFNKHIPNNEREHVSYRLIKKS
jgi:hypothetical protein